MRQALARLLRRAAQQLDPEPEGFYLSGFYWDDEDSRWVLTNPALTLTSRGPRAG